MGGLLISKETKCTTEGLLGSELKVFLSGCCAEFHICVSLVQLKARSLVSWRHGMPAKCRVFGCHMIPQNILSSDGMGRLYISRKHEARGKGVSNKIGDMEVEERRIMKEMGYLSVISSELILILFAYFISSHSLNMSLKIMKLLTRLHMLLNLTVEIDESMFAQQKSNVGRVTSTMGLRRDLPRYWRMLYVHSPLLICYNPPAHHSR